MDTQTHQCARCGAALDGEPVRGEEARLALDAMAAMADLGDHFVSHAYAPLVLVCQDCGAENVSGVYEFVS